MQYYLCQMIYSIVNLQLFHLDEPVTINPLSWDLLGHLFVILTIQGFVFSFFVIIADYNLGKKCICYIKRLMIERNNK